MNWGAIGAIGEVLGAIAVFVTLLYLSVQIRQNTRAVQATGMDSLVSSVNDIRRSLFESPELSELYIKGSNEPALLDQNERLRYRLVVHNMLMAEANLYAQSRLAGLADEQWKTQKPLIGRIVCSEGGRQFWQQTRGEFPNAFRAEVDQIIDQSA